MVKGTHSYRLDKHSVYWWISWGARHIPTPIANFIGDRIADWLFYYKSENIVPEQIKNLDHVLGPDISLRQKRRVVRKLWRRHGRFLLDLFRFERMSDAKIASRVPEFVGLDNIKHAIEAGKGAIILTAHIGHWELGGILLKYLGFKVNIVQYLYESEEQNRLLDRNKEIRGIRIISADDPAGFALSTYNALKRNEIVAIQGDRDLNKSGIRADFFGKPATFPKGPMLLAMKTGAPLIPAFTIMGEDGKYHPIAERPIDMTVTGDIDADLRANISKIVSIFEKYVRSHPEQWFNFYYFWD